MNAQWPEPSQDMAGTMATGGGEAGDYVTYGGNLTEIFCMRRFGLSYSPDLNDWSAATVVPCLVIVHLQPPKMRPST